MIKLHVDYNIYLKEIELADAAEIYQTIDKQREYLSEWLPFVEITQDIRFTQNFIKSYLKSDRVDKTFIILFDNEFVGLIGLKDTDTENFKTEIGYWLSEPFQHKGIITKSCKTILNYAFYDMDMHRIKITVATENYKSQKVAERLGFTKEGIERDGELHTRGFVDLVVYGLLRDEFTF